MAEPPVGGRERRPLTVARLFGLDRSGPPPAATQSGSPLRPWTIPNAIGFARLALIPVFLVGGAVERRRRGRARGDAVRGDRLGRLRGRDRGARDAPVQPARRADGPGHRPAAVVSGVVVCWRFELLPRWALAVLAVRELVMLALGRYGLRHGVELRINWPGRLAVAPVMGWPVLPDGRAGRSWAR